MATTKIKWDQRDASGGRYTGSHSCDGCGKFVGVCQLTDERLTGTGDGPGFWLCMRKACMQQRSAVEANGGLDALREHYQRGRERAEQAAWGKWATKVAKAFSDGFDRAFAKGECLAVFRLTLSPGWTEFGGALDGGGQLELKPVVGRYPREGFVQLVEITGSAGPHEVKATRAICKRRKWDVVDSTEGTERR